MPKLCGCKNMFSIFKVAIKRGQTKLAWSLPSVSNFDRRSIFNFQSSIFIILNSVSARFSMENPIPTFTTGRGSVA